MHPPDLNASSSAFTSEKRREGEEGEEDFNIRIGFSTIKNVGDSAAESIVREREESGEFTSISDFILRMAPHETLNRKGLREPGKGWGVRQV